MATSTSPDVLLAQSSCYSCIPDGMQREVMIMLLNKITRLNLSPVELLKASACYQCIPDGMQEEVQTMMLESVLIGLE